MKVCENIDKAFVISIKQDRRKRFYEELNNVNFPVDVDLFEGIVEDPPEWYKTTKGFWGCYRSHFEIMKLLNSSGWKNVLIFEDDAKFLKGFEEKFKEIEIPDDWDWFYLGGKPIRKAVKISDTITKCNNINLAHAYMINKKRIDYICWFMENHWKHYNGCSYKYFINDWKCGEIHGHTNAYLCLPNLVSQHPGMSSTENKLYAERKF